MSSRPASASTWSAAGDPIANPEDLPSEPCERDGFHQLFHGADDPAPGPAYVPGAGSGRRRILHFAVTSHPTAEWTVQQLREVLRWDTPRYLLWGCDRIFGQEFVEQVKAMDIKHVLSAPRSPWQRAYVERLIGAIRRECLDHLIVFNEDSLSRHLQRFCSYYHRSRTHLGLQKTRHRRARCNHQMLDGSSRFRRWADSISFMSAAQPEAPNRLSHL